MQRVSISQALTAVPQVSSRVWRASSLLVRWLISMRAGVLVMTFASVLLGGLLAFDHPSFDPLAWTVCVVALLLAHGANNQLNDLTDYRRGIDRGNYFRNRYGTHVLVQGLMSERGLVGYFVWTGGAALLLALWLLARRGPDLIPFVLSGGFLLLFYTWPLKRWGVGELAVWLVWGPLMVGGTVLASTGTWHLVAFVVGGLSAVGPTTVIFGKHLDKLSLDQAKGVATLPVRLGEARSRYWVRCMLWLQYAGTVLLVGTGWLPTSTLLVGLALPKAWSFERMLRTPVPLTRPAGYSEALWPLWFAAGAFDHTRLFGLLFVAGVSWPLLLGFLRQAIA
jgi:1,4-dihydroxy-2-naphthoate octaprenyltransferase